MYYAKVFKEDLGRGLEILSDILINSLLDEGAVHRERDVIIREMEEVNKQQEEVRTDLTPSNTAGIIPHLTHGDLSPTLGCTFGKGSSKPRQHRTSRNPRRVTIL